MAVKNATTRKKIATVKFTEAELEMLGQVLANLEYTEDLRGIEVAFKSAQEKIRAAKRLFIRYT